MKTITRKVFTVLISLNIVLSSILPAFFGTKNVYAVEAGYCQDGWTFNGGDAGDDSNWENTGCGASQNDEDQRRLEEEQRQREEDERRRQEEEVERKRQRQEEQHRIDEQRQREEQEQRESEDREQREADRQRAQEEEDRRRQEQEAEDERRRTEDQQNEEAENVQPAETQTSYVAPEPDPQNYYTPPPQYNTSFTVPANTDLDTEGALINPDKRPKQVTTEVMAGKHSFTVSNAEINATFALLKGERLETQLYAQAEQDAKIVETVKAQSIEGINKNQNNYTSDKAKYEAMLNTYNHYKEKMNDTNFSAEQRLVWSAVADYAQSQLPALRDAADKEAKQSAAEAAAKEKTRREKIAQDAAEQIIQEVDNYMNSRAANTSGVEIRQYYKNDRLKDYDSVLQDPQASVDSKINAGAKKDALLKYLKDTEEAYNQQQAANQAANQEKQTADLQKEKDRKVQEMRDYLDNYAAGDSAAAKDKRKAFANHFLNEYKKALTDPSVSERTKEEDKAIINYLEEELKRLGPQTAMEILTQRKNTDLKNNPASQPKAIADVKNAAQATAAKNQGNAAAVRQAGSGGGIAQAVAALPNKTADAVQNAVEKAADFVEDLLGGGDNLQSFHLVSEVLAQTVASPSAQPASKSIQLIPGWNLVTVPGIPTKSLTAKTLLQEVALQGGYATTVSGLENGQWTSFVIRGDVTFGGNDFAIEPGKSYFVKALLPSVYIMIDSLDFVAPIKLNVNKGWNAVGVPYASQKYSASTLLDKTENLSADALSRWESGLWDTFIKKQKEEYGENFVIERNRGYLLRVGKDGTISP